MEERTCLRAWTMPEEYVQPPLFSDPADDSDELLDESSLNTVLDMLAVMTTAEELTQLETLTEAQKRQVWAATSVSIRMRLKQIRASAAATPSQTDDPTALLYDNCVVAAEPIEVYPPAEVEIESVAIAPEEITSNSESNPKINPESNSGSLRPASSPPSLSVGDWVVLKAKPKLSKAELMAIWEVLEIHEEFIRITAKGLGTRNYPLDWLLSYPKPVVQSSSQSQDESDEDEF